VGYNELRGTGNDRTGSHNLGYSNTASGSPSCRIGPVSNTSVLIDNACRGDRDALDELYARHQGRLLHFIRARMPASTSARVTPEDILQETLLEVARKIDDFESRGAAAFYRWMVEIARFKLMEAGRAGRAKKRALEAPLNASVIGDHTSPSGRAMRGERARGLHEALATLPERQAEAVRLRYLEGLTVAESAERLDVSADALKSLVSRAMAGLAERLGNDEP
jgi:RNA polymerase sigma-70 factor (ECF subfamily)